VPIRPLYETTRDMPQTILDVARAQRADLVLMEATRRNILWRALFGDEVRSVLAHLPERVGLLLHAA
ncbi:universal stress protein, partial [Singulisphaera rosea]